MGFNSLPDKVNYLISPAKRGNLTKEELKTVEALLSENSGHPRLGRFFGYSISDYAFASLYWLKDERARALFDKHFAYLDKKRKENINNLIKYNYHLEY